MTILHNCFMPLILPERRIIFDIIVGRATDPGEMCDVTAEIKSFLVSAHYNILFGRRSSTIT